MKTNDEIRRVNLKVVVEKCGGQTALARLLNKDKNQVYAWLKGGAISTGTARQIEDVTNKERGWMDHEHPKGDYRRLPVLAQEIAAGSSAVIEPDQAEVVRWIDVAEWWAQRHLPNNTDAVRLWSVRGDSMAPEMQHGDVLFVDVRHSHFDTPGIYVLNWGSRPLVKRLMPEVARDRLALISTNPAYPPEYIDTAEMDTLSIVGKVVAWWTLRSY
ncbi:MAG: YdaS family helix-turn-helix protein [Nitrosospira sp.]|nr:YdaS family helix-turn-helix protein [Nitrosospira sp.]